MSFLSTSLFYILWILKGTPWALKTAICTEQITPVGEEERIINVHVFCFVLLFKGAWEERHERAESEFCSSATCKGCYTRLRIAIVTSVPHIISSWTYDLIFWNTCTHAYIRIRTQTHSHTRTQTITLTRSHTHPPTPIYSILHYYWLYYYNFQEVIHDFSFHRDIHMRWHRSHLPLFIHQHGKDNRTHKSNEGKLCWAS